MKILSSLFSMNLFSKSAASNRVDNIAIPNPARPGAAADTGSGEAHQSAFDVTDVLWELPAAGCINNGNSFSDFGWTGGFRDGSILDAWYPATQSGGDEGDSDSGSNSNVPESCEGHDPLPPGNADDAQEMCEGGDPRSGTGMLPETCEGHDPLPRDASGNPEMCEGQDPRAGTSDRDAVAPGADLNTCGAAPPNLNGWTLSAAMLDFYPGRSDEAAWGGELAHPYPGTGTLTAAQAMLAGTHTGSTALPQSGAPFHFTGKIQ